MATKRPGEKYLGQELHLPLSGDGQVMAYVWPVRVLNVRGEWCGGPTIGVDVGNEEVLRYDCHDKPGHWHGGGYDKLGMPGASHRDFPAGIDSVERQVQWALQQLTDSTGELLTEAEFAEAAAALQPELLQQAAAGIRAHLEDQGDLRSQAVAEYGIAD